MGSDYELVRYQPDLKSQVIELQTHLWSPHGALNAAYFEWKFERNPYHKEPLIYLAMHQGKSVGMRGFFGVKWEAGVSSHPHAGLYADDAVIAPEHRKRALMPRIMATAFADLANRGYDYVFNLSAGQTTFLSSLAMGWRSAGSMQPMQRRSGGVALRSGLRRTAQRLPLASRTVDGLFDRWDVKGHRTLEQIDDKQIQRALNGYPCLSFEDHPRCADMAALVERIGHSGRIRHVRDTEYFNWRFQNPLSRYRFLYWAKEHLEGYLVLHEYTSDFADRLFVNIVDWEASSETVKTELLQATLRILAHRRLEIWSATLPQITVELLGRSGFKLTQPATSLTQQCPAILVRSLRTQQEDEWRLDGLQLTDLASWDIRMLYSMAG